MGHAYKAVQWTPYKKAFDTVLAVAIVLFLIAFAAFATLSAPPAKPSAPPQLLIRAFGACAFSLLTVILAIGPLARLSPRFLPLLYNRRHLGVACFLLALLHAAVVLVWYHGFSHANPLVSLLASNPRYTSIQGFPFESLGLLALGILLAMAATSHDFWNANLGPSIWKGLHMAVYAAYAALVGHIFLGAVQADKGWGYAAAIGASAAALAGLHLVAGLREVRRDGAPAEIDPNGWLLVGAVEDIADGCARIVVPDKGERIAVFRDGDKVHALSNRCRHQGGPLGEGRIIDGCVTCPWHGFQYRPEDGRSPPPFTERVAVYPTRIVDGVCYVRTIPRDADDAAPASRGDGQ